MATDVRRTFSLDGEWSYLKDEKNEGIKKEYFKSLPGKTGKMKVPSNWYLTEVGDYAGVIWFAREFEYDGNPDEKDVRMKFHAVDYIADVYSESHSLHQKREKRRDRPGRRADR